MISAYNFQKAQEALVSAEQQAKSEMPTADFVFIGVDNRFLYFNVVAKPEPGLERDAKNLKEKTRFGVIREQLSPIYKGEFWMEYTR